MLLPSIFGENLFDDMMNFDFDKEFEDVYKRQHQRFLCQERHPVKTAADAHADYDGRAGIAARPAHRIHDKVLHLSLIHI